MSTFAIDLLTGSQYLFNGNFASGGTSIQSASNGLTKTGSVVGLGGNLCCNTTINGDSREFYINNASVFCVATSNNISGSTILLCAECVQISQNWSSIGINGTTPNIYLEAFDTISGTSSSFTVNSNENSIYYSSDDKPINYCGDYSSCYTNRSIVDKEYVDNVYVFQGLGGTTVKQSGTNICICSVVPSGSTVYWSDVKNKPDLVLTTTFSSYTGTTLSQINGKINVLDFNNYTGTTGLQQVTDINAQTTVETDFKGGVKLHKIRPTGNTTTAIQINAANGTTHVINVDTVSGFTGFGTITPKSVVHIYGNDNSGGIDGINTQSNAVIIDGPANVDKDINWSENGIPHWLAETYRNEKNVYWYLYNVEANNAALTVMETGRIGVNKQSNLVNYHTAQIIGNGLNDLIASGVYSENFNTMYEVEIFATGVTDTWKWRKSVNNGIIYTDWSVLSGATITPVELEYGMLVNFENISGHTEGNTWSFIGFSQIPQGTFTIAPMIIQEVQTSVDYEANPVIYKDITAIANGGITENQFTIFTTGTKQALYWGTTVKINSIFFNLSTFAENIILHTEYWNGSGWKTLEDIKNHYIDDTTNLSKSGRIIWSPNTMTDWTKSDLPDLVQTNYNLYWMRIISTTSANPAPIIKSLSIGNDKRFAVYNAFNDIRPSYYVDSLGRVNIGGGNITGSNKFQVNPANNLQMAVNSGTDSLVEFDSENSSLATLKLKTASNDNCGSLINFSKTRGTLNTPLSIQTGDFIGKINFRGRVEINGGVSSEISSQYTGDGSTTRCADLIFSTTCGLISAVPLPIERVRITSSGTTGFGISPTAVIHLKASNTSIAPLKFTSGTLLTTSQSGAVEFLGDKYYGTITTGQVRKTFAFLESPVFCGAPELPVGTTLNSVGLCNYIWNSGGTGNANLITTSTFNTYTGSTQIAISKVITGATNGICKYSCHNICLGGILVSPVIICGNQDFCLQGKRIDIASSAGAQIWDKNGCNIEFYSSGGTVTLKGMTSAGVESMRFKIGDTQATFTDSRITPRGVEYNGDYSSTFNANSLVSKSYVDSHSGGLFPKAAVEVATTAYINLASAPATIGGVTLTNGMRILVKNQGVGITGSTANGIYNFNGAGIAMTRSSDFVSGVTQVVNGSYVAVLSGATNQNTSWILTTPNPITVGVNPLVFVFFASTIGVVGGNGICSVQTGGNYHISTELANNCGLCVDASGLRVNSNIAGTGLAYNTGVLSVNGNGLAGNSLSWTGTQLAVNTTDGTLSSALNQKLNITTYCSYTGTTINDINNRLLKTTFSTYTGTTAPLQFASRSFVSTYTGTTAPLQFASRSFVSTYTGTTAPNTYAPITSPTFLLSAHAPKSVQNDNSTCIATTSWYISQGASTNPLMDGSAGCGISNLFARQDHIHPSDTSRVIKAGDVMTGALTINSNLTVTGNTYTSGSTYLKTLGIANITTDDILFWNPISKRVNAIHLTGGSDSYFYADKTLPATSSSAGILMYLSGAPWTFKTGKYQVDFNAQFGNSTANGTTCVIFAIDGVTIGTCYQEGGQVNNWVSSASLSRDVTLSAGCRCLTIQYARGGNTSCMTYGMIRAKRIC